MKFFGIALRRPRFAELTAAAVLASGLWILALAALRSLHLVPSRVDAGALLLMIAWGCMSVRIGLRMDQGQRHVAANVAGAALLLALYQLAVTVAG